MMMIVINGDGGIFADGIDDTCIVDNVVMFTITILW